MKKKKVDQSQPNVRWLALFFDTEKRKKLAKTVAVKQKKIRKTGKKWKRIANAGTTAGFSIWKNRQEYQRFAKFLFSRLLDRKEGE